jgi:hypothetical protein
MKFNQWTLALASVGIVSLGSVAQAEEQHSVMTALSSTTLSGYVDTSASWWTGNQNKPGALTPGLPGRTFDGANKQDGFNLNAVKLVLEKPLGDATTWSAGYKADLVFGPDADYYASRNTITGVAPGVGISRDNFSVKQAYVALRAPVGNGLDLKLGVWDTIIGYEFFEAGANPNYSRSYGYALEPTHHTGLLASYKITDMFSISGGIANSFTGAVNDRPVTESKKTYMAAITVTLPESAGPLKNSVISAGYVGGENGAAGTFNPATTLHDTRSYYAGFTLNTPLEGLQVGAAWDYRENGSGNVLGAALPQVNDAYAIAAYVTYGMDKWKINVRADYTQASNGTWYTTPHTDRDELGSLTGDLEYNLWENVLTRLEARYDRALSGDRPFGNGQESAFTIALNAIYKF